MIVLTEHKTSRKTGKPRRIMLGHPALVDLLKECIGGRTEGHIFLRWDEKPWNVPLMDKRFATARKAGGLRKELVLYLTRHEFATDVYGRVGDIKSVGDLLGHTQIATANRYARANPTRMKAHQAGFVENL